MVSDEKYAPIKMGMIGMSVEDIEIGKQGYVMLPIGVRNPTMWGGREWVRIKVTAMEDVRANRDIIVGNEQGEIKEHTPVELSYEKATGGYQRAGEGYPLPTTKANIYDDYKEISFTATEQEYTIGTAAHEADPSLPLSFAALSILFYADQDCKVRFNGASRVQHKINSGAYISFDRRVTKIYIVRDTVNGTLQIWTTG